MYFWCSSARARRVGGRGGGGEKKPAHQLGSLEVASLPGAPLLGLLPLIHQESGCGSDVAATEAEGAARLHPAPRCRFGARGRWRAAEQPHCSGSCLWWAQHGDVRQGGDDVGAGGTWAVEKPMAARLHSASSETSSCCHLACAACAPRRGHGWLATTTRAAMGPPRALAVHHRTSGTTHGRASAGAGDGREVGRKRGWGAHKEAGAGGGGGAAVPQGQPLQKVQPHIAASPRTTGPWQW